MQTEFNLSKTADKYSMCVKMQNQVCCYHGMPRS